MSGTRLRPGLLRDFPSDAERIKNAVDLPATRSRCDATSRPFSMSMFDGLLDEGHAEQAQKLINDTLGVPPDSRRSRVSHKNAHHAADKLHRRLMAIGEVLRARRLLDIAINCSEDDSFTNELVSHALLLVRAGGSHSEVLKVAETALRCVPKSPQLWIARSESLWFAEKYADAYAGIITASHLRGDREDTLFWRVQILADWPSPTLTLANADEFLRDFSSSPTPRVAVVRSARAYALGLLSRGAEATDDFKASIGELERLTGPRLAIIFYRYGRFLEHIGDSTGALESYRKTMIDGLRSMGTRRSQRIGFRIMDLDPHIATEIPESVAKPRRRVV